MFLDEKAQVSVELILVLAAIVAIALLVANSLVGTAEDAGKQVKSKAKDILDLAKKTK